jgi:hypothetical protein
VAGVVIVCYIQYTISPEIIAHFHNPYLYFNIIFVIAGFLRLFPGIVCEERNVESIGDDIAGQVFADKYYFMACQFYAFYLLSKCLRLMNQAIGWVCKIVALHS